MIARPPTASPGLFASYNSALPALFAFTQARRASQYVYATDPLASDSSSHERKNDAVQRGIPVQTFLLWVPAGDRRAVLGRPTIKCFHHRHWEPGKSLHEFSATRVSCKSWLPLRLCHDLILWSGWHWLRQCKYGVPCLSPSTGKASAPKFLAMTKH
jgi:hypothetical protein